MQNLKKRNTCWRKKFQDRVVKTKEMGANSNTNGAIVLSVILEDRVTWCKSAEWWEMSILPKKMNSFELQKPAKYSHPRSKVADQLQEDSPDSAWNTTQKSST